MHALRPLAVAALAIVTLVGCPGDCDPPDGCTHCDDERVTQSTCRHPADGGGWVYHSD